MKTIARKIATIIFTVLVSLSASAQINTDQVILVGRNAMYFEDYVLSIQYFNQAIRSKPHLAQPYLYRAIAKFNLDDFNGAIEDASTAIQLNEFLPDAWEVRGVARQNLGDNDGAVDDYNHALSLIPRNRQIMFNKAMALAEAERHADADTAFAQLLGYYPGFANGYIGRAKLLLEENDTVAASADIDKALQINPNLVNGYILRAGIAIDSEADSCYNRALADMNEAVKLEPRIPGLYINRAFLRYRLDDYFGAMADYDYALQLEPLNTVALFNRGLLRMEVSDDDLALIDFTQVLNIDPDNYRALYNRAVIENKKHDFNAAIADLDKVIERFPDFPSAWYLRSLCYEGKGNITKARRDYDRAMLLMTPGVVDPETASTATDGRPDELTEQSVARRFDNLLTINNDTDIPEEYNNSDIRGKVQDRDHEIEIEPAIELSYYSSPSEHRENTYYIKEVDDLNQTHALRRVIMVTARPPQLSDEDLVQEHFNSIDYYTSYLSTHTPRAVDYIGRAMDFLTVKNYEAAITDLDKAVALTPDHPLAYFMRAQARSHATATLSPIDARLVLADLDRVIELTPLNAMAWYNKGNVLFEMGDYTSAIAAYTKALQLRPDMGEAFYNRGYVYFKLGNRDAGLSDLSKAGELGIISAYNLMKRISKTL